MLQPFKAPEKARYYQFSGIPLPNSRNTTTKIREFTTTKFREYKAVFPKMPNCDLPLRIRLNRDFQKPKITDFCPKNRKPIGTI